MKIVAQRIIRSLQYDKKEEVELQKFLLKQQKLLRKLCTDSSCLYCSPPSISRIVLDVSIK